MLALTDSYNNLIMGLTTENLAAKYEIIREEQDKFVLRSHQLATTARESGRLAGEIVPVDIKTSRGATLVEQDEYIRPDTTLEKISTLWSTFREDETVTAGNASGINDGAAAVIICTEPMAKANGWQPLTKLLSWVTAGVDPDYMGNGPVPAIHLALERAQLTLGDIDLIEINEAFAAQYIAVEKELEFDRDRANVNGGAIALGHPVGASGARILLTLLYELRNRSSRNSIAALCIGGCQGIAAVVVNLQQ